jgi:Protein of unknown function (DUF559)
MSELGQSAHGIRVSNAKVRVHALADRQNGRVSRVQLAALSISDGQIDRWLKDGYLIRVLPHVYAVGHTAPNVAADLTAAVLYAGPDAMLRGASAASWLELILYPPPRIHVSSPHRRTSLDTVVVHHRRCGLERIWHNGIPTTTIAQTVLDLAATEKLIVVRRALSQLDFERRLDLDALNAACGRGRPGSAALKTAMRHHQPMLARARSPLEVDLILLCERFRIPVPEINAPIHGVTVDALWRAEQLVVELDGGGNHSTWAQIKRDRKNELKLRAHGIAVQRYTDDQLRLTPAEVGADIWRALGSDSVSA